MIGEYLSQKISANTILLSTPFAGARGYDQLNGTKEYRLGLTYGFPVWYPDFGLGSILYSRRVRLQPFYDVAYSDDKNARYVDAKFRCRIDCGFSNTTFFNRASIFETIIRRKSSIQCV